MLEYYILELLLLNLDLKKKNLVSEMIRYAYALCVCARATKEGLEQAKATRSYILYNFYFKIKIIFSLIHNFNLKNQYTFYIKNKMLDIHRYRF